jgi:hypothetical protein
VFNFLVLVGSFFRKDLDVGNDGQERTCYLSRWYEGEVKACFSSCRSGVVGDRDDVTSLMIKTLPHGG